MARYTLAYAPDVAHRLVLLPPRAEKLGRERMLELAEGPRHSEARPAIEQVAREIFGWAFVFLVDHRHHRVTLTDVRWTAGTHRPVDGGAVLFH